MTVTLVSLRPPDFQVRSHSSLTQHVEAAGAPRKCAKKISAFDTQQPALDSTNLTLARGLSVENDQVSTNAFSTFSTKILWSLALSRLRIRLLFRAKHKRAGLKKPLGNRGEGQAAVASSRRMLLHGKNVHHMCFRESTGRGCYCDLDVCCPKQKLLQRDMQAKLGFPGDRSGETLPRGEYDMNNMELKKVGSYLSPFPFLSWLVAQFFDGSFFTSAVPLGVE